MIIVKEAILKVESLQNYRKQIKVSFHADSDGEAYKTENSTKDVEEFLSTCCKQSKLNSI